MGMFDDLESAPASGGMFDDLEYPAGRKPVARKSAPAPVTAPAQETNPLQGAVLSALENIGIPTGAPSLKNGFAAASRASRAQADALDNSLRFGNQEISAAGPSVPMDLATKQPYPTRESANPIFDNYIAGGKSTLGGLAEAFAVNPDMARFGQEMQGRGRMRAAQAQFGNEDRGFLERGAVDAAGSAIPLLSSVAGGILTKRPAGYILPAALPSLGQAYSGTEGSEGQRGASASLQTLIEQGGDVPEALVLFASKVPGMLRVPAALALNWVTELGEEGAQKAVSTWVEQKRNPTADEIISEMKAAIPAVTVMTGLLGAPASVMGGGTLPSHKALVEQGRAEAPKPAQQAAPVNALPPPAAPVATPRTRPGMFDDLESDATADPINPQPQPAAVVETARPQFGAVVETPGPRAIIETPAPRGIVETARPPAPTEADTAITETPAVEVGAAQTEPPTLPASEDIGLPPPESTPMPAPDAAPASQQPPAEDAEMRGLTEGLIRQLRDAKQMNMDSALRRAIERVKDGGVNEKPAYFAKLAKEFERKGDARTAGALNAVATTLKARQKAIPKPAQPRPPRTKKTGEQSAHDFSENSRKRFLGIVKAIGGVSAKEARDITGEPVHMANRMLPGFFRADGNALDLVARRLHETGYLSDEEYDDVDGGVQLTRDLLRQALDREFVGTPEEHEYLAQLEAKEAEASAALQEEDEKAALAEILGETPTEAEFAALFDAVPTDETQDRADLARAQEQENDAAEASRIERESGEVDAGRTEKGDESRAGVDGRAGVQSEDATREARPDLSLDRQTERDLAEREREINRREAEQNARERAALDKERADRERSDFTLTGSDRAADANGAQGAMFARRKKGDDSGRYETDLFGNPLPENAGTGPDRTEPAQQEVRGNLRSAAAVPRDTQAPEGEYDVRTTVSVATMRELGASSINSAADLAQATRYLYKSAVERFDAVVTDKNGKPLAVVGGFKGAVTSTSVYPGTLIAEAVRIPGAANIWFSHNHPSGTAVLSQADRNLSNSLADAFSGSGIEPQGVIAVAGDVFGSESASSVPIPAGGKPMSVPVVEREVVGKAGDAITGPESARELSRKYYEKSGKRPGVLLLDAQNRVSAWVPLPVETMGRLRRTGGLNALYRAISESNAYAAVMAHGGELDARIEYQSLAQNIGAALAKMEVRVLDEINVETALSAMQMGRATVGDTLFRRAVDKPGARATLDHDAVKVIVERIAAGLNLGAPVTVHASETALFDAVPEIGQQAERDGAKGEIEAVYYKGRVHVVSSKFADAANVETAILDALAHEGQGHYAIRMMHGNDARAVRAALVNLYREVGGEKGVRDLAKKNGVDMRLYLETARGIQSPEGRAAYLADELLAHLQGKQATDSIPARVMTRLREYIGAVREWLRAHGLLNMAKGTDADIALLLRRMREAAKSKPAGVGGKARFSRAGQNESDFVHAPDGSTDFGEITAEQSKVMRRQAGKIRLQQGDSTYGMRHIEARHGKEIRALGYGGVAEFVFDIANNVSQILTPDATSQLVAISHASNDRVMFVELRQARDASGDYYSVRSAFPARKGYAKNKGWEVLWEGRAQPSADSGSSAPFAASPSDNPGKASTIPSGSSSNVAQKGDEDIRFARRVPSGPNSPQQPMKLGNAPGFDIDPESRAEAIQRTHQDRMNRWAKVQRQIKEQGGTVALDQDVYHAMERMTGRAADRIDSFTHETVRPLLKRVADLKTNLEELGTYLMALGAKDRNAYIQTIRQDMPGNGSGMTDAEAARIIADYRARPDFAKFDALARDFQALTERKLKVLVGGGVLSQQQAADMKAAFGFYVPYKGFEKIDESGNQTGNGTGGGYSTPKRATRQAFGRVSKAGQVVENIIRDYEQAVIIAEKVNVGRYVRNLANANADPALWTVDQPPTRPVMVNGHVAIMQASFDNQNEIRFIENGQEVRVQLHDKLLAQTYNNLGQEQLMALMKVGDAVNRILRQTYTQKNPAFIFVNAVRDVMTGLAVATGEMGAVAAVKMLRHAPGAWKTAGLESFRRGAVTGEWAKYMDAYRKSGAQTAYYAMDDIEAKQARLHELLAREGGMSLIEGWRRGGLKKAGSMAFYKSYNNRFLDVVESLNGGFENMMRLAAFRQYIDDNGGIDNVSRETLAEASRIAKNLTVNFNRKGEATRTMNALYLFWNANIQGTQNLYRAAMQSQHKGQVRAILGTMVGLGVMLALSADDDDEDLTPDYVKDTSLSFMVGDTRIQIPLAYGLGYFVTMGRNIGNLLMDRQTVTRTGMNLAGAAQQHFSPFGNVIHEGDVEAKDLLVALTPTVLKPAVMTAANRNQMGFDVVPKFGDDQPDRPAMRMATRGGVFDKAAGGLEAAGMDVSPETLKLWTQFVTGGLGTFITDTASATIVGAKGEFDVEKTPIVKRFVGKNDVEENRARFYELAEDVKKQASEQGKKQKAFFGSNKARDSVMDFTKEMKVLREAEMAAYKQERFGEAQRKQAQQIRLADAFKKEHERMAKRGLIERR